MDFIFYFLKKKKKRKSGNKRQNHNQFLNFNYRSTGWFASDLLHSKSHAFKKYNFNCVADSN